MSSLSLPPGDGDDNDGDGDYNDDDTLPYIYRNCCFYHQLPIFNLFPDSVVQRSPRMSGAKADAELRSKTDNLERMITEVSEDWQLVFNIWMMMIIIGDC